MPPKTLLDILEQAAEMYPTRGFHYLSSDLTVSYSLSYNKLHSQARAVASEIQKRGTSEGQRALLSYDPGLDFIVAFWGCLFAGVLPVPAPAVREARKERTMGRVLRLARDCQPTLVLSDTPLIIPEAESLSINIVDADSSSWQRPSIEPENPAFLQYTSGSTRHPRGVVVSHANALENLRMLRSFLQPGTDEVFMHWLPLHHDMGLIRGMLSPIEVGADCYLMNPLDFVQRPAKWLQALSRYQVTITGAPNFGYQMVTSRTKPDELEQLDLSSVGVAFCSAEPIRPSTVERFLSTFGPYGLSPRAFKPSYGLAEATVAVTGERGESYRCRHRSDERSVICCGQALGDIEVLVVDDEAQCCQPDIEGEIWLRGGSVAKGYWISPKEDDPFKSYLANGEGPYLRTGDLGFLDAEGNLYITGRKKDLLIVRGQNFYPQELEAVLEEEIPELRAGCTAVYEQNQRIGIVCESRASQLERLGEKARRVIGEEFGLAVGAFTVLSPGEVLKTSSGKLQRSEIKRQDLLEEFKPRYRWKRPSESAP